MKFQYGCLALLFSFFTINSFAQQRPSPTLDQLKSKNFAVLTLDGKRLELSKLIGQGKPVVLDFWATWCGPCRAEIPYLKELTEKYRRNGLVIIGLNLENPVEDRKDVADFVKELSINYEVVFAPISIYRFFNPNTTGYRIPQTYVFDPDGNLVRGLSGYSERSGKEVLRVAVEKAVLNTQVKR